MHNFFVDEKNRQGDFYYITDSDFNHIKNVLRMKIGDEFLVSVSGKSDLCVLEELTGDSAVAKIQEENYQDTSLPIKLYLFQGLPKADKMELVIQKAVELGVEGVIPVEMNRCVVKIEEKKKKSKQARWQAISESAAKQSKRTVIPEIFDIVSYKQAMEKAKEMDLFIVPYESKDGMNSTKNALSKMKKGMKVGILIGPEGGFEEKEIFEAEKIGGEIVSLGKRILRTETAAITALSMCMLYAEMNIEVEE
ncbi:MAG: 16S rRNA (uracil(1498)-N(3))-methyltransferase [Clostridia bacterium]|nr:16S rRNA (uracil(1498)-N(3))-methyltransferase [Clostridia bacterium]